MIRNDRWERAKLRRLQARRERLGLSRDPLSRLRRMQAQLEDMERDKQRHPCGAAGHARVEELISLHSKSLHSKRNWPVTALRSNNI